MPVIILAVESSCDETSVAIVKDGKEVISHVVLSQIDIHQTFGGVVPEIASRNHVLHITRVFEQTIKDAKITEKEIDLVAVTEGPGLIGALLVGINAATAFAYAHSIPLMGVNHLMGHIYGAGIEHDMTFPAIALLISGGHTELILMEKHMHFKRLGTTLDDAIGEAYDKVARTLGLGYPGGPEIDQRAQLGKDTYSLPRPYLDRKAFDFSFSGLKSAVINLVHNSEQRQEMIRINDLCASFQASVLDVVIEKTRLAAERYHAKQIIVAGGVAANRGLRNRIYLEIPHVEIIMPSMAFCTDNAAMIAAAAFYQYQAHGALPNYLLGGSSTLTIED